MLAKRIINNGSDAHYDGGGKSEVERRGGGGGEVCFTAHMWQKFGKILSN